MTVQFTKVDMSIAEMDRAILVEGFGCSFDDKLAKTFTYSYGECVLVLEALAKKMVGLSGVAIGNNPLRAARLGVSNGRRDFKEERKQIKTDVKDRERRASALQRLDVEEKFVAGLDAVFDSDAWNAVNSLTEDLSHRAMALHRAGLVQFNVDNIVADEAEQRDKLQGGTGASPMEGSVVLTEKGKRCVSAQRFPKLKKRQRADAEKIDYDVEVNLRG